MVTLKKGQRVNLTKNGPPLKHVLIGLGWDVNRYDKEAFDLDVSAFLLNSSGKCSKDEDFVFYGNLKHPSGAIEHSGDNRTGCGDGDDEVINVDLNKIPDRYESIVFVATIYDAAAKTQNFDLVSNAYIRLVDRDSDEELVRYPLNEKFSDEDGVIVAELYRRNGSWGFHAIGNGYSGGLAAICARYGIDAE